MTPVQEQAIVPARRGKDLQVTAQTGTGKTAAFAIPVLQRMLDKPKDTVEQRPRALILTPTRELAEQIAEVYLVLMRKYCAFECHCSYMVA